MHGLTVRWSLTGAPEGVGDALRAYVEATSYGRYSGRKDLRFKTWRMRDGEWFEGCYVFETTTARGTFERELKADAGGSPSSQIACSTLAGQVVDVNITHGSSPMTRQPGRRRSTLAHSHSLSADSRRGRRSAWAVPGAGLGGCGVTPPASSRGINTYSHC